NWENIGEVTFMAISIQITGESAKEVKELVGELDSVVFGIQDQGFPQTTVVSTIDEAPAAKQEVKQTVASVKETPKQEAVQEESVTSITIEELRALAQEKNKAVGSAAVREVLGKYG